MGGPSNRQHNRRGTSKEMEASSLPHGLISTSLRGFRCSVLLLNPSVKQRLALQSQGVPPAYTQAPLSPHLQLVAELVVLRTDCICCCLLRLMRALHPGSGVCLDSLRLRAKRQGWGAQGSRGACVRSPGSVI